MEALRTFICYAGSKRRNIIGLDVSREYCVLVRRPRSGRPSCGETAGRSERQGREKGLLEAKEGFVRAPDRRPAVVATFGEAFEETVWSRSLRDVTFFEYLEEIVLYCYKKNNNLKVF